MTPERIILIDDSEPDNFFHELALKRAGFTGEVKIFQRPEEGVDFLLGDGVSTPTLLLLDINMPVLNGFQVASLLANRLKPANKFRAMLLTSSNWNEDRARAQENAIIEEFLVKPLSKDIATWLISEF